MMSPHSTKQSMSMTMSPTSTAIATPQPEVVAVHEILGSMKQALTTLALTFDSLGDQTSRVAAFAPAMESAKQIETTRRHMYAQDARQQEKIDEVKALLKDVLQSDIIERLREEVEEQARGIWEDEVRKRVAIELEHHFPPALQDRVVEQRAQLEEVKRALHNSESRRANALLRYKSPDKDRMHTLYMRSGKVSPVFPIDLTELFGLDFETATQLVSDYGMKPGDSREENLNRFMQFCGVSYQMVPSTAGK